MTTTTSNAIPNEGLAGLREEYRIALRLWSETKALYPSDSAEVQSATDLLNALEADLATPEAITFQPHVAQLEPRA